MPAWSLNNFIRTPLLLLAVGELLILYSSVYVGALILYGTIDNGEVSLGRFEPSAVTIALVMLLSLISMGLYNFHQRIYFYEVLIRIAVGFVLGTLVLAMIFYAVPSITVSRPLSTVAVVYAIVLLLTVRFFFYQHVDRNKFRHRTLVYGAGQRARAIADLRRKADRRGFKIVGSVPAPGDTEEINSNGLLIRENTIDRVAQEVDADEIVIAMDDRRGNLPVRELLNCKLRGINIIDLVEFLERETGKIRIDLVNPGWLVFSAGFRASVVRRYSKRTVDFVSSIMILALSWPIMLLIAVAIKLEDGMHSSVLYRQRRVGEGGVSFEVLKFRSMHEDAEADGRAVWAEKNDNRITRVGSVLRKYRLDEYPQVFNVIRGHMSLVGPRPERPEFVEELSDSIPYYSERHTVKPGITGWAQLRYAYGSSKEDAIEKLQFDLYYVKNHNFLLDLMIMLQTVEVIIWGKGAR